METLEQIGFSFEHGASGEIPETFQHSNDYTVTLSNGGAVREFDFFKGERNTAEPELREVLECLVLDFNYSDGVQFEDWAQDLGMDSDSIRALGIYNATLANNKKLLDLFDRSELVKMYETLND
jgi:hypothetical protein